MKLGGNISCWRRGDAKPIKKKLFIADSTHFHMNFPKTWVQLGRLKSVFVCPLNNKRILFHTLKYYKLIQVKSEVIKKFDRVQATGEIKWVS